MPSGSPHTPEDVERGLAALIIAGSSVRASEVTGIKASTLREWKMQRHERYEALRHELEPQVARTIAAEAESIALKLSNREHLLADALTPEAIKELKPADIASTLRNVSTSKALQVDKISSPLRERPSHVQHTNSPEELASRIARALGFTDSTAEEIPYQDTTTQIQSTPSLPLKTETDEANAQDPSSSTEL